MTTIDTLESKLSSLLSKLATLEINKNFFNSKFPDGIDIGGGGLQGPQGPQGPQGNTGPQGPAGVDFPSENSLGPVLGGGYKAWNYSPVFCTTGTAPTANGLIFVVKLYASSPLLITNLHLYVTTAGATLTAGQNFAAIYDSNKNLLGTTADQSAVWNSTGLKTMAISGGPVTVPAGIFYIAFFANATTRPAFLRTTSTLTVILNGILSTANAAFASANTGRTTSMPATLGAFTAVGAGYWTGVS